MWRRYPNTLETRMRFNFSSPLGMDKVTSKYMEVGDGDGEGKTRPCLALMSCLGPPNTFIRNPPTILHVSLNNKYY